MFGPGFDRHALVQRPGVRAAVERHVVPDEDAAELRLRLEVKQFESGRTARLWLIKIDHRGPGALAAVRLIFLPIGLIDVEEVGMLPEALPLLIALPLQRFAIG